MVWPNLFPEHAGEVLIVDVPGTIHPTLDAVARPISSDSRKAYFFGYRSSRSLILLMMILARPAITFSASSTPCRAFL
jgi:hypothetical protein